MQNHICVSNKTQRKENRTEEHVEGLKARKILGAGLDVLEYKASSFYSIFKSNKQNSALSYLLKSDQVLLSPHVGGWTVESRHKLAQTILDKIKALSLII